MSVRRLTVDEAAQRSWDDPEALEELHVRRGWAPADIARKFQTDAASVREELKRQDLFQKDQSLPPKQGLARKLWEMGTDPDAEGEKA